MRDFQSLLQKKIASPATSSMKGMDQATITFLFTKILEEEYGIRGKENVFVEKFEEKKIGDYCIQVTLVHGTLAATRKSSSKAPGGYRLCSGGT
jgi:hypothetical protein